MIQERDCRVPGHGVTLEGRLSTPAAASGGIVLCHPHPLHGGDMHNPVIERAAEVCAEAGLATLRFNFRGVGASTGQYDDSVGADHFFFGKLYPLGKILGAFALELSGGAHRSPSTSC